VSGDDAEEWRPGNRTIAAYAFIGGCAAMFCGAFFAYSADPRHPSTAVWSLSSCGLAVMLGFAIGPAARTNRRLWLALRRRLGHRLR
jgi:hypothetical protein